MVSSNALDSKCCFMFLYTPLCLVMNRLKTNVINVLASWQVTKRAD